MDKKAKAKEVIKRLKKVWPHPKTALNYNTPLELLVATILSAQATDKLVNTVTPKLFKKFKSTKDYAHSSPEEVDKFINKINFHNNKARSIYLAARAIEENFAGIVPVNLADLITLPGVARKTASVVLGNAFNIAEGIVVDTHVMRLSLRLGLTTQKDPIKIEKDLMEIIPKKDWIDFSHLLINFGRQYCPARKHNCNPCPLGNLCPDF